MFPNNGGFIIFFIFSFCIGICVMTNAYRTNYFDVQCGSFQEVENTSICIHGAQKNACGKLACLKGVGEPCGENFSGIIRYGKCASALMCCGVCTGCQKGVCNDQSCRKRSKPASRPFNLLDYY